MFETSEALECASCHPRHRFRQALPPKGVPALLDYFILRDHQRVEGEEIIGKHDGYDIVRKGLVRLF
jgi:hypothetical protein